MLKSWPIITVALVTFFLAGCNPEEKLDKVIQKGEEVITDIIEDKSPTPDCLPGDLDCELEFKQ